MEAVVRKHMLTAFENILGLEGSFSSSRDGILFMKSMPTRIILVMFWKRIRRSFFLYLDRFCNYRLRSMDIMKRNVA